jgi:hypothetical protein
LREVAEAVKAAVAVSLNVEVGCCTGLTVHPNGRLDLCTEIQLSKTISLYVVEKVFNESYAYSRIQQALKYM